MLFTQNSLGMLLKRYRSVLKKCRLLNALGAVVLGGFLALGAAVPGAGAADVVLDSVVSGSTNITATDGNIVLRAGANNAYGSIAATGGPSAAMGNINAVNAAGVNQSILQASGNKLSLSATGGVSGAAITANSIAAGQSINATGTLQTATGAGDNLSFGNITAAGDVIAYDASKPEGERAYDINAGSVTAGGVVRAGDIETHGDLIADHVETFANADDTLQASKGNPGTVTVNGALNIPGDSKTGRRLDVFNVVGSDNVIGNVRTGACIGIKGNGVDKSTLTAGVLSVGAGSFTLASGVQAKVKELIFDYPGRKARVHGDNPNAATTLDLDKFTMFGGNILVEASWDSKYSMAAVRNLLTRDGVNPGDLIADGNIAVGANAMLGLGKNATMNYLYNIMRTYSGSEVPTKNGVRSMLALTQPLQIQNGFRVFINGDLYTPTINYPANTGSDADSPFVTTMLESGTFTQGANTMLVINGDNDKVRAGAARAQVPGAISYVAQGQDGTTTLGDAKIEAGAKLVVTGAETGQTYVVLGEGFDKNKIEFTKDASGAATGWQGQNLIADNPLVSLSRGVDGSVSAGAKSASQVFPSLDGELVSVVDNANVNHQIGMSSYFTHNGEKGAQFLSRAVKMAAPSPFGYNQPTEAAVAIESAARMAVIGAVPQMTLAANQAAGAAITQRTSLANPLNNISAIDDNGNPITTSGYANGFALWVMPLYQSTNGFGMEAGNFDYDFSGSLGGVAIGADWTFDNAVRAGISFNIGGGYAEGSGDLNDTTNSSDFWGVGAYAGWNWSGFGLTADIDYTSSYNKLKQDLPSAMGWDELKADINSYALSMGLRAEYKFNLDALDVIPHVSARYTYLNADSYDIKHHGTVIDGDSMTQNIWTFPIGVTLTKNIDLDSGWHIKPLLDLNVTPATGDIKAKSKIRFTGTNTEAELKTKMMDYFTYGGTAGIEFGNNNLTVGINYNGQFGAESSAHGIFGVIRYEF